MTFKLDDLFTQIDKVIDPSMTNVDQGFSAIRKSIRDVELEDLPPEFKHHFGLTSAAVEDVKLRRQFSVETIATLGFAKRSLSFLHGAQNVVLYGKHKTLSPGQSHEIFKELSGITKNFLQELEAAKPSFTIAKQVKKFEAKQFQHYLAELNNVLAKSIGEDYHKTYAQLAKGEKLASWYERPIIATYNQYKESKSERLIIERPMVTPAVAEKTDKDGMLLYPFSEYNLIPTQRFDHYVRPHWFAMLKPLQQNWLIAHREELIKGKLGCPPSILRDVPGAANFTEHDSYIKTAAGVNSRKISRNSTARPIDMKKGDERDRLRNANGLQVVKTIDPITTFNNFWNIKPEKPNHPILNKLKPSVVKRSLLSPLKLFDRLFTYKENNRDLAKDDVSAITKGVELFNEEHAQTKVPDAVNSAAHESHVSVEPTTVDVLTNNWSINGERGANNPFDKEHFQTDKKLFLNIAELVRVFHDCIDAQTDKHDCKVVTNFINYADPFDSKKRREVNNTDAIVHREKAFVNVANLLKDKKNQIKFAKMLGLIDDDAEFDEKTIKKIQKIALAIQAAGKLAELWYNKLSNKIVPGVNPLGRNRRLFAVNYEDFMLDGSGAVGFINCKSSRDRVGTEEIHGDAMQRCYFEKGFLPDYYDKQPERNIFVELVAEEFINGHQQTCAEGGLKDGKGALNVVNTEPMLPKDIQNRIEELKPGYLEAQNVLAKTNKPKIGKNPYAPRPLREKILVIAAAVINILGGAIVALGMLGIIALGWPVTIPLMIIGIVSTLVILHATGTLKSNVIKTDTPIALLGIGAGLLLHHVTFGVSSLVAIAVIGIVNVAGFVKTMFDFAAPNYRNYKYQATKELEGSFKALNLTPEASSKYEAIMDNYKGQVRGILKEIKVEETTISDKNDGIKSFFEARNKTLTDLASAKDHVTVDNITHLEALLGECFKSSNPETRKVGIDLLKLLQPQPVTLVEGVVESYLPSMNL